MVTTFALQGTNATRYIRFDIGNVNLEIVMKGLRKMKELRFLNVADEENYLNRRSNKVSASKVL